MKTQLQKANINCPLCDGTGEFQVENNRGSYKFDCICTCDFYQKYIE